MLIVDLGAIVADGFDGTTFHRFPAKGFFFRRFGLLVNIGVTTVVVAFEIGRRSFAAQVAIDALFVDIEFPGAFSGYLLANAATIRPQC